MAAGGRLGCELSQGYTLQMVPPRATPDGEAQLGAETQTPFGGRTFSHGPHGTSATLATDVVETPPAAPR